jgi:pimeloyl-ACP methyl ester carboxylesterase
LSRRPKAQLYRTRTRDGWSIAVWNYHAEAKGENGRRTPVLVVHGLGSNRHDLDCPDDRYSLARYLHADGFDVWIVELRGAGASNHRVKKALHGFTIDDYIEHDLPAALRLVEDETGEAQVHWVGHSLGGSLAYPFMATNDSRIRSAATIGAPTMNALRHARYEFALPLAPSSGATRSSWGRRSSRRSCSRSRTASSPTSRASAASPWTTSRTASRSRCSSGTTRGA